MAEINRTIAEIKERYGPRVARAFSDAMTQLRSDVVLRRVIEALESGDIERALGALNIDEAVLASMRAELTAAFAEAGTSVTTLVRFDPPGETRAVVRFNVANPDAERRLREWLGQEITDISEKTRTAAREALSEGFARGQGPRQIALDVVGRIGPNGRRTGGVLGLNVPQKNLVQTMRQALSNDGFVDDNGRRIFWIKRDGTLGSNLTRRDRRFDRSILRLIREGGKPTRDQITKWTGRYADSLLRLRGDTIARTETAAATEQGRIEAFRQGVEAKGVPLQYVEKEWRHGGGGMMPREFHVAENSEVVQGIDTPFTLRSGVQMQHPHDPDAPIKERANCTCSTLIRVNWARARRDGVV